MIHPLKIILPGSILIILSSVSYSQFQQDHYILKENPFPAEKTLELYLNGSGFFNNNEFFDTEVEGYTLTGNYFQPVLNYNFSKNFSVSGGAHLLWYHGQDKINEILPFFSLNYLPFPNLKLKIGSYSQGGIFELPEPLYKFENQFTDLTGNGVQIIKTGKVWSSITWLNWITFIEPGDPFREEFNFGHSGKLKLWANEKNKLDLPLFLIANHKGGQINDNDEPVETRADLGAGLQWTRQVELPFFNRFSLLTHYYQEQGIEANTDGNAIYTYAELDGDFITLGAGYFREENWESILGEPLFFSPQMPGQNGDQIRDMLLFKAGIAKSMTSNSSFMIRFEGYYDFAIKKFQYTYGIHIIMNEWLSLFDRDSNE
jgi:hypothetical protein